ncbi:sensor histidine kinase/response regulator [Exophiala viscosa]|uniref:sensor histidine kinase/response regulator n=1 Tax=Exophiala viscosa TaxID=2486360 RepID=UPI0021A03CCB|nr:sensor histidine kinase/response regulator [Exophiala viscosa]
MPPDGHREGAREREMHRYYQPWLERYISAQLEQAEYLPPKTTHNPRSSRDKALTAFAQLGCLRLNARRGIITLLDSTRQYIIAEATQSLSLLSDAQHIDGDELWFGNSFIERGEGVSGDAMFPEKYTAHAQDGSSYSAPALVVNDLAKDERYKTRGYAGNGVSFYCGVPITTSRGYVIGVYTVTDDKPRDGLSPEQLRVMCDMAVIVAEHLESVKSDRARARGERLIRGIGAFIEGESGIDSVQTTPGHQPQPRERRFSAESGQTISPGHPKTPAFKGMVIGDANTPASDSHEAMNHDLEHASHDYFSDRAQPDNDGYKATIPAPENRDSEHRQRRSTPLKRSATGQKNSLLSPQHVFDRAATILRTCVNADGVVFINASAANLSAGTSMNDADSGSQSGVNTLQHSRAKSKRHVEHLQNDAVQVQIDGTANGIPDPEAKEASDSSSSGGTRSNSDSSTAPIKKQFCELWGTSMLKQQKAFNISQQTLRRFVRRHPKGKCFTFDKFGKPASSDESSESASTMPEDDPSKAGSKSPKAVRHISTTTSLIKALPEARNIVFLPLWDFSKERWHAAVVLWSNDPSRLTNIEDDMSYLAAFNNALMNEVNRINLALSDTAKATFLANISHELRSPLHGILGSIEFLHDTNMDDFQAGMVISVETCGKTLLDTVNHVLDYAKINNLSNQNSKRLGSSRNQGYQQSTNSDDSLTGDFDMALIVEEAVEAVYAGQVFRSANTDALEGKGPRSSAAGRAMEKRFATRESLSEAAANNADAVRLTLNIDDHMDWRVRSQPGAIRRVVMNILGNALKYTNKGSIDVSLVVDHSRKKGHSHLHAHLKVTDTGRGMSGEFMKNHAFTAFSQEDSLATGTGLGLSIVRQIVDSLGGKIDLASEKDAGTEISIWLSLPKSQQPAQPDFERNIMTEMRKRTKGLEISLLLPTPEEPAESQTKALRPMPTVESSMKNLLSQWFSMNVTKAKSMEGISPSFFLYPEPPRIDYLMDHHGNPDSPREIPVIVLCTNAFEAASLRSHGLHQLTDIGRIIEIISQPCGPQKLAKVLHRCMQRMKMLETDHSKGSTEHVPMSMNRNKTEDKDMASKSPSGAQKWQGGEPESGAEKLTHRPKDKDKDKDKHKRHSQVSAAKQAAREELQSFDGPDSAEDLELEKQAENRPRVLVVDDNNINLHLLVTFVRKTGNPHESATNGLKALEAYKRSVLEDKKAFKYILMDISMPIMNGIAATKEIRKFEKENQIEDHATIIALTGLGSESAQTEAYQAGFDNFLSKPIKFRELQRLLT